MVLILDLFYLSLCQAKLAQISIKMEVIVMMLGILSLRLPLLILNPLILLRVYSIPLLCVLVLRNSNMFSLSKRLRSIMQLFPHNGKRHSFGPFDTEIQAAERVREFLQNTEQTSSVPTRGEKRTEMFHFNLNQQLQHLNTTAKDEKRHCVVDTHSPTCSFCQKSVHTYHAIKFAQQLCPSLTHQVDKKGSATRAQKLSETRTAVLQSKIDSHNCSAISKKQHFISSLFPPHVQILPQNR